MTNQIIFKFFLLPKFINKIIRQSGLYFIKTLILLFISLIALSIRAQNVTNKQDRLDGNLIIEKKQKVILRVIEKERPKMLLPKKKYHKIEQQYKFKRFLSDIATLKLEIDHPMPEIKNHETLKEALTNYLTAGFGNYETSYLESFVNYKKKRHIYGAYFKHISSNSGPVKKENSGFSNNNFDVFGSHYTPNGEISASINYNRYFVNFYGSQNMINKNRKPNTQIYSLLKGNAVYQKKSIYEKTNYTTNATFYRFSDNLYNSSEYNLDLKGDFSLAINDNSNISFGGNVIFNQYKNEDNISRNIYAGSVAYQMLKDKLSIKVGLNLAYNSDTNSQKQFNIYPDFKTTFKILEDKFSAIGSISGGLQQQTFRSFVKANAYLTNNLNLAHTNSKFIFSMGLQAKPSQYINLKIQAAYNTIENLYFFTNNLVDPSVFDIKYDSEEVNVLSFKTEGFISVSNLKTVFVSELYRYKTKSFEEAWHKPSIKNQMTFIYNEAFNRFFISANFFHLGGIKAKDFSTGAIYELNAILDLNLKAEYTLTKKSGYIRSSRKWSIFVNINNIFSKQYQRYLYYPVKGFNVILGATYNF